MRRAGMKKISESRGDRIVREAVGKLAELGFKVYAPASVESNLNRLKTLEKEELEKVKNILLSVSLGYYKRLKSSGKAYVQKEEFKEFILDASISTLAKVISRLAVLAQTKVYLLWKNRNAQCNNIK
jgi:hypothetical protein